MGAMFRIPLFPRFGASPDRSSALGEKMPPDPPGASDEDPLTEATDLDALLRVLLSKAIGESDFAARLDALNIAGVASPRQSSPPVSRPLQVVAASEREAQAAHPGVVPAPSALVTSSTREEPSMSRLDNLNKVLRNLQSGSPGVEASALISEDGLIIASALPQDLDETRVGGMSATLLNLGTRAATELRRGDVREIIVRGELGCAVMINASRGAVLLVLAAETTPLGLIFFDMREALKSIRNIL